MDWSVKQRTSETIANDQEGWENKEEKMKKKNDIMMVLYTGCMCASCYCTTYTYVPVWVAILKQIASCSVHKYAPSSSMAI